MTGLPRISHGVSLNAWKPQGGPTAPPKLLKLHVHPNSNLLCLQKRTSSNSSQFFGTFMAIYDLKQEEIKDREMKDGVKSG